MFSKPTARRSSGRKNHDRCAPEESTLDLSTVPALRRALKDADLPVVAQKAECKTADIIPFIKGKQGTLPTGLRTRVRQAVVAFHKERQAEALHAETARAAPQQPAALKVQSNDPDWLVRGIQRLEARM